MMRKLNVFGFISSLILIFFLFGACRQPVSETTITLGYNPFLSDSFTDAPPPIDVIRSVLAERHPEITLEYYVMPQDLLESLIIWMTSRDTTVDIFGLDVPWVTQFGRAGWAEPLNNRIPDLGNIINPAGLDTFSYEGKRLAVPFWGGVAGLYYRTDLLRDYGFSVPTTVNDMISIITTIQAEQPDMAGLLWPGMREESLNMYFATLLYAFGGQYTRADGSYDFASPAGQQALQFMYDSINNGWSPRAVPTWNRLESRQQFVAGNGIFSWDNHDIITWLDDPEQSQIAGKWDFIPFPKNPGGKSVAITGGFGFAMNPYSKKLDTAAKVLGVIADPEVQKGFALAWGPVQHSIGLYDDPEVQKYNPNVDKLAPLLDVAMNRPPSQNYAELSDIMQQELNAAITGITPISQALQNMNQRASGLTTP